MNAAVAVAIAATLDTALQFYLLTPYLWAEKDLRITNGPVTWGGFHKELWLVPTVGKIDLGH